MSKEIIYGVENSKQESYNVKTAVKGGISLGKKGISLVKKFAKGKNPERKYFGAMS